MKNEIDDLLKMYAEQFDDTFPIKLLPMSEDEIIDTIRTCIEKNEPFKIEYDPDSDY